LQYLITSMVDNLVAFKPLGFVVTLMLGSGLANNVGILEMFINSKILIASRSLVNYAVIFTGMLGKLPADAAYISVTSFAAMFLYNIGRHPLAGLAAGFAGVGSGFTANIIVSNTDAVLSGISAEVMSSLNTTVTVTPVDNYYFMLTSVFLLSIAGALITG